MRHDPEGCVAWASSERGEVVLLRRACDGALELRVNGVFVMDTVHTFTETLLADRTLNGPLGAKIRDAARVLIGGLGLGFTLRAVLSDARVADVHVAEIEPAVVEWNRRGLVPETAAALEDDRLRVSIGDVRDVLAAEEAESIDIVLLDVDNGPGYLVYDENVAVYQHEFLALCGNKISSEGLVAVWSADPSTELAAVMRQVMGYCEEITIPMILGSTRKTTYHLYIARRDSPLASERQA